MMGTENEKIWRMEGFDQLETSAVWSLPPDCPSLESLLARPDGADDTFKLLRWL